ncbi:MAG: DUF4829 domain-containing protein [Clostridia bacterium]|nr:DUF4829 domain-containing protein [Clostridia bacterium]
MKKYIGFFLIILLLFTFSNCSNKDISIEIGPSSSFTEKEIENAINLVIDSFSFPDSKLTSVIYDEEVSNSLKGSYLQHGKGSINGVLYENVIVLISNFDVDGSGNNPVLNPDSTYYDYQWILIRDNKESKWIIDDQGY